MPRDFLLFSKVREALGVFSWAAYLMALTVGVLISCLWYGLRHERIPAPLTTRILAASAGLLCLAPIFWRELGIESALQSLGVAPAIWNQKINYEQNDFLLAFLYNAKGAFINKPRGYLLPNVAQFRRQFEVAPSAARETTEAPDVIFYLYESFFDPTALPLTFSRDPIPNFHSLAKKYCSGKLIVPSLRGLTPNTEFEILTGLSMAFLPVGSIPFQQLVMQPLPSLARDFQAAGYETQALHTFQRTFWNRDRVYPLLGFSSFKGLEDFPELAVRDREFPRDEFLVKQIEKQLDD